MKTYINDAQAAFWKVIAEHNPDVLSGDLPPETSHYFDHACETVVRKWCEFNTRKTSPIDVLASLGFEECSTGGGCTALEFTRPDGEQCLVTNDAKAPVVGEGWDVGFYDADLNERSYRWYDADKLLVALSRIAAWRVG